jgi:hypothetical protein
MKISVLCDTQGLINSYIGTNVAEHPATSSILREYLAALSICENAVPMYLTVRQRTRSITYS